MMTSSSVSVGHHIKESYLPYIVPGSIFNPVKPLGVSAMELINGRDYGVGKDCINAA